MEYSLKIREAEQFKAIVGIIANLASEVELVADNEFVRITVMDPANVAMVLAELRCVNDKDFNVQEPIRIGMNLNDLHSVLKQLRTTDQLRIESCTKKNKYRVRYAPLGEGPETGLRSIERHYDLPTIEHAERKLKEPELVYQASVTIPAAELDRLIKDADVIGESVTFATTPGFFNVRSESDLTSFDGKCADERITSEQQSKYSIEYLKKIVEGQKLSGSALIEFSNDNPLRVTYQKNRATITFILAPRVDED